MIKYIHGSHDSVDTDVIYVLNPLPSFRECQSFCSLDSNENRNIIEISEGIVSQCYKGTIDEINNALIATYDLHPQTFPLLIEKRVPRDVWLKIIRVIRCLLSHCSRTIHRKEVKKALKSSSWNYRLEVLEHIDFLDINDYGKDSLVNIYKIFAFQLGQVLGLIDGVELYTKTSISNKYSDLHPYIYREETSVDILNNYIEGFIGLVKDMEVTQEGDTITCKHGTYDLIKEINICTNSLPKQNTKRP